MSDRTTADVLREAARLLMRDGWTQGTALSATGKRCAVGALREATEDIPHYRMVYDVLAAHLGLGGWRDDLPVIPEWNDAPERTAEDVILAFKQCAYDLDDVAS